MSCPVYAPSIGNRLVELIDNELAHAKRKFPDPDGLVAALMEEVGELAKAMLEEPVVNVEAEAVQVAALAIRIAQQGDPTLSNIRAKRVTSKQGGLEWPQ